MRVLFVGDVYGRPGREALLGLVPMLRTRERLDAVVVNCENAAKGSGITPKIADEMLAGGVDVLTGGNHSWQIKEIRPYIESQPRLIRPGNHEGVPGKGHYVLTLADGRTLAVVQVEGQVFMRRHACPFDTLDKELAAIGPVQAILVDVHAEATSEKQAIAHYLNGKVSAVIGTHTHVQTADFRVLEGGTAYISDLGMTGSRAGVIGMQRDPSVRRT